MKAFFLLFFDCFVFFLFFGFFCLFSFFLQNYEKSLVNKKHLKKIYKGLDSPFLNCVSANMCVPLSVPLNMHDGFHVRRNKKVLVWYYVVLQEKYCHKIFEKAWFRLLFSYQINYQKKF